MVHVLLSQIYFVFDRASNMHRRAPLQGYVTIPLSVPPVSRFLYFNVALENFNARTSSSSALM
jgi:hypothetical protein